MKERIVCVLPGALHRDVVDVERQAFGQLEPPGADHHHVAGLCHDQRFDEPLLGALASLDRNVGRTDGAS